MLMTQHNLWFYQRLMQGLRDAIAEQRLDAFASEFSASRVPSGVQPRSRRPLTLVARLPRRRRQLDLVLGPQLEVAGVVALVELLGSGRRSAC